MGTWFEMQRSQGMPFQKGEYSKAVYALQEDGKTISVTNSELIMDTREMKQVEGVDECLHPSRA